MGGVFRESVGWESLWRSVYRKCLWGVFIESVCGGVFMKIRGECSWRVLERLIVSSHLRKCLKGVFIYSV